MMLKYVTKSEFNAATGCHSHPSDLRPMALRPCLSTGLPLYIEYMFFSLKCQHFPLHFELYSCLFFTESAILFKKKA